MNKVQLEFQVLNNKLEKLFERLSKFSNEQLNQKVIDGKTTAITRQPRLSCQNLIFKSKYSQKDTF